MLTECANHFNVLKLTNRFASKAVCDGTPGDPSVVGVAGVVDEGEAGVGEAADPLGGAPGEVLARAGEQLRGLVRVVVGGTHEVVQQPPRQHRILAQPGGGGGGGGQPAHLG